ncbi:hypothetical protein JHK82_044566 [Glycine max]|nr:hypothetical protein JHK82_044566 [Glycine max]
MRDLGAHHGHVHPHVGVAVDFDPFHRLHPPPITMTDTDTLQQLQNRIAEMEQCHKEELIKLKADHDQLEARVRRPQGDEHPAHTFPECTQRESHPRHTVNTKNNPSLLHIHRPTGRTTRRHPFINQIMEIDIALGWKPLNLKWYEGTINPNEHLDAFLT